LELDGEAIICNNFMSFSERTFIRMMAAMTKIAVAKGLPITDAKSEVLIRPSITGG